MLSQRLQDFLLTWCNPETDPDEVAAMLRGPDGGHYRAWLPREMSDAIRGHELTRDVLAGFTGVYLKDEAAAGAWLRRMWSMWFPEPYPGD